MRTTTHLVVRVTGLAKHRHRTECDVDIVPEKRRRRGMHIADAASGMHIASRIPNQTSHTLWKTFAHGWLRWAGAPKCLREDPHRTQISKECFDQAERRGIFVDPVPAETHWHIEQVENHARYLRMMDRTVEDLDIDDADFQVLLDELTGAKNNLLQKTWIFAETVGLGIISSCSPPRS